MVTTDRIILVVDDQAGDAEHLKDMLEFMDAPEGRIVSPDGWNDGLDQLRIAAVFLTQTIGDTTARNLIREIGNVDPNVPIVMLNGEADEKGTG